MPEYWIGDVEGRVLGPVSLDVVQDLVNTGRLTEITQQSTRYNFVEAGEPRNWNSGHHFVIGAPERDAWLRDMGGALGGLEREGRIEPSDADELRAYLDMAANTLVNG